jgi:hypothetical protein
MITTGDGLVPLGPLGGANQVCVSWVEGEVMVGWMKRLGIDLEPF